ncbi:MAG: T9SS type A sorting domain-containing protein [Opitutaceae bacterium]|nr:T9SS type A sorting domain-containing protein [Cytophagales bacterium]
MNLIECSALSPGVYFAQFKLGKNKITRKIIIN